MLYDVIIIGGGPAGIAGGVYSARKRLKTLFLTYEFGGQSSISETIENWIGTISISGADLSQQLKNHLEHYAGEFLEIKERVKVTAIEKTANGFLVTTTDNQKFETKTVLMTTGSHRRKLTVPGAAEHEGRGIVYCASCDAPMFENMDVAVIGGGNAGFGTASQLTAYARSITLLHHSPTWKAEQITVDKVLRDPKIKAITNAEITSVLGDKFVSGLTYLDKNSGETVTLPIQGIFVEIGNEPETALVKDLVELNNFGSIKVDPKTGQSSVLGIWAAGDCTDALYHQNNIAAGAGVIALENIYDYLAKQ